jgi:hypothetical protein
MASSHDKHGGARRHEAERSDAYAGGPLGGWCNWQARGTLDAEDIGFESLPPSSGSVRPEPEHVFVRGPRFTEAEAREALANADCWSEALRMLGMRVAGGNHATLKRSAERWGISTDHPDAVRARNSRARVRPLDEVLVQGSTYHRAKLQERLYAAGLKKRELRTQQGASARRPGLPGVRCHLRAEVRAAVLLLHQVREAESRPRVPAAPHLRLVERPPYEQLMREIEATSYLGVGRKYGVSDNAIRKWVRAYEREREASDSP